ncbi:MAG: hypothetical protein ABIJ97_05700 [Bacteroidota bacterium]
MKYIIFIILFALSSLAFSQGLRVDAGGNIIVQNTANVIITGNGNWTNNGTANCIAGSWVRFAGNAAQIIQGTNTTAFSNAEVNNSGAGVQVGRDISILSSLLMTQGDFDLKASLVDLSTTGILNNETSARRVKATDAGGNDGAGIGTIRAIRTNPIGNISNLGLTVNMTGVNVNIIRGHLEQTGTGSFSGNSSVFRYFQIDAPAIFAGTSVTFLDCYPQELNFHNPVDLIMFQWVGTAFGGPYYWTPVPDFTGAPVSITQNLFGSTLDWTKVTLGSEILPLPVELIAFNANCENHKVFISWTTASELNNDYFEIQKSENGIDFYTISQIQGAGSSSQLNNYIFYDYNEFNNLIYYRLKQVDYNGSAVYSNAISTSCSNSGNPGINIYNVNNGQEISVEFLNIENEIFYVTVIDQLGKRLVFNEIQIIDPNQKISIDASKLSMGLYNVIVRSENFIEAKQVLIAR